jgi:hypothetical protein
MWAKILEWLGSIAFMEFLKKIVKWVWGYAWSWLKTMWDNAYVAYVILIAGISSGLFLYYYNMLYNWFGFPLILNIAVLGIFALVNLSWVVSNWKQAPSSPSGDSNSGLNVRTGN